MGAMSYVGGYLANRAAYSGTNSPQKMSFRWADMAVASVGGYIGGSSAMGGVNNAVASVGKPFSANVFGNFMGGVINNSLTRLTGRGRTMHGDDWGAMAADAFGNALATNVVDYLATPTKAQKINADLNRNALEYGEKINAELDAVNSGITYQEMENSNPGAKLTAESDKAIDLMRKNQTEAFATESEKRADEQTAARLVEKTNQQNAMVRLDTRLTAAQQQTAINQTIVTDLMNNRKTDQYDAAQLQLAIAKQEGVDRARVVQSINQRQVAVESITGTPSSSIMGQLGDASMFTVGAFLNNTAATAGIILDSVAFVGGALTGNPLDLDSPTPGDWLYNLTDKEVRNGSPSFFKAGWMDDDAVTGLGIGTGLAGGLGAVTTTTRKVVATNSARSQISNLRTVSGDSVNAEFVESGFKAPYLSSPNPREFSTAADLDFVRVHGPTNQEGVWMVRPSEIEGMSPVQIKNHLALKYEPTHISPVTVLEGAPMRVGRVGPQTQWGSANPKGIQYELFDITKAIFHPAKPL